ncbi:MAG: type II toxin-antitoxin system HicA family toxin [Chloroflexi bacterium]|nr:type II toxin-antitoxin system HicA family toxin [Chloroflexota bacterium]
MGKYEKLLTRIVYGKSDAEIAFADLCNLLGRLGFTVRIRRSHHIYRKKGGKAKPYQVRQVRNIILKYKLGDQ